MSAAIGTSSLARKQGIATSPPTREQGTDPSPPTREHATATTPPTREHATDPSPPTREHATAEAEADLAAAAFRVHRAPLLDPPFDDELAPDIYRPPQPASESTAAPADEPPSPRCQKAASRFLSVCLELFNGYRPVAQMRLLLHVEHALELVDELVKTKAQLDQMRLRHGGAERLRCSGMRVGEPRRGVAEVAAVLTDGLRTWAMCYRLETDGSTWRCTYLRAALPSTRTLIATARMAARAKTATRASARPPLQPHHPAPTARTTTSPARATSPARTVPSDAPAPARTTPSDAAPPAAPAPARTTPSHATPRTTPTTASTPMSPAAPASSPASALATPSDAARSDAARSDAARSDAARSDAARSDAARSDAARSDAARSDAAPSATPVPARTRAPRAKRRPKVNGTAAPRATTLTTVPSRHTASPTTQSAAPAQTPAPPIARQRTTSTTAPQATSDSADPLESTASLAAQRTSPGLSGGTDTSPSPSPAGKANRPLTRAEASSTPNELDAPGARKARPGRASVQPDKSDRAGCEKQGRKSRSDTPVRSRDNKDGIGCAIGGDAGLSGSASR